MWIKPDRLDVFVLGSDPGQGFAVDDDAAGVAALIERPASLPVKRVVLEATGRYGRRAAADLLQAVVAVAVAKTATGSTRGCWRSSPA